MSGGNLTGMAKAKHESLGEGIPVRISPDTDRPPSLAHVTLWTDLQGETAH